ncbi:hypothetical protein ABAC460_13865 [Asticcacaulis sp. AC460]|uniref:hypothetical protein n=1 Tax=Asticcacaulis sp. AC460 TaxID=1282360 RepID=UPI0003C3DDC4|nr:hypothetical protein [Asticcacaulis sp. AC460]ESQ88862.1 hypothetical protein ABAC460_13865 [Asticcacaulis sp. AC460]
MRLDFGAPFSRFFDLLGKNFALFFALGLIGVVLPAVAISYGLVYQIGFGIYDWTNHVQAAQPLEWAWLAGGSVIIWLLKLINLSMVTEVAILRSVNKRADIGAAIGNAVSNIIPLFIIAILVNLMILGGMILLIVPGIIWALASCVSVPIYVAERGVGVAALGSGIEPGELQEGKFMSVLQTINIVFEAVGDVLTNIFVAAIYVCLRQVPGKQSASQAASVFE